MATKCIKPSAEPILKSLDDCDSAYCEAAQLGRQIAEEEATLQSAIDALKSEAEERLKPRVERKIRLEKDIEEFATYHRDDLFEEGKKTVELAHCHLRFQKHPASVAVKTTLEKAIAAIKALYPKRMEEWIRTKEELKRDVLVNVDKETLAKVGLKISQKETFRIIPLEEAIAEKLANRPAEIFKA